MSAWIILRMTPTTSTLSPRIVLRMFGRTPKWQPTLRTITLPITTSSLPMGAINGHENVPYCSDQEPADNTLRGDQWLQQNVPLITNSPEFQNGGILFITWDEAEDSGPYSDGPIPLFVLSPFIKGGGYTNSIHYDHSSLLKTLEELFGVQPLLGAAADPATNDLSDFANLPTLQK